MRDEPARTDGAGAFALALRLARFGAVGVAATLTHVLVVIATVELFGLDPRVANAVGWGVAIPVSYVGHYFWTFGSRAPHGSTLARFVIVSAAGFLASQGLMTLAVATPGLGYRAGLASIVIVVPLLSFVLNNALVFHRSRNVAPEDPRSQAIGERP